MNFQDLDTEYSILKDKINLYRNKGHVLLRDILKADLVSHFRSVIADGVREHNRETRSLEERTTYGKAFLQTTNLWRHNEEVKRFVFARRFAQIAADLMGVEKVRLYHDQALFKEPGGGLTPWHQDMYYWPFDTDKTITMWMPLIDISKEMGMLTFASRSHKNGLVTHLEISDDSNDFFAEHVKDNGYEPVCAEILSAGDATFHNGYTIHSAPENNSRKTREVMTVIYYADGTKIAEPLNKAQAIDLDAWFGGQKPGELAGSEITPVL